MYTFRNLSLSKKKKIRIFLRRFLQRDNDVHWEKRPITLIINVFIPNINVKGKFTKKKETLWSKYDWKKDSPIEYSRRT